MALVEFLDPVFLARVQFALTVSFHIICPSITVGLATWLAVLEWRWIRTGEEVYRDIYRFWVKIFAVCFGMGVVSGLVLPYEFGTNWSVFSERVGNVIGPLLAFEVLTAFFLEASFLGIMLFGWGRVSKRMHFASTCIVAAGTILSAFWILSVNSWMQTPAGFEIGRDGVFYPVDWMEITFNPSFPYRFYHMINAAFLTTASVVAGVGAYYLWRGVHLAQARIMFNMAMCVMIIAAPLQLVIGHLHGGKVEEHQPVKVAAIEGNWERGTFVPLQLFSWPDEEKEVTRGLSIPGGASFILTGSVYGEVPGLRDVPASERPPVAVVFWAFRIMAGIGFAMCFTAVAAFLLRRRGSLFDSSRFHLWCIAMAPSGFLAVLSGWFVTEVGRQPYIVYGLLRTAETVSPVGVGQLSISLLLFSLAYLFVFGAALYYILRHIVKGPDGGEGHGLAVLVEEEVDKVEVFVSREELKGEPV